MVQLDSCAEALLVAFEPTALSVVPQWLAKPRAELAFRDRLTCFRLLSQIPLPDALVYLNFGEVH